MRIKKEALCRYVKGVADDSGIEALKLFLPVSDGYVNFNIVHSVMQRSNCDTWRLSTVYHYDDSLSVAKPLTRSGAEWEMALMLKGRPDFIGGYAHGDEVFNSVAVKVDGVERELISLDSLTPFSSLTFEVQSTGYDPGDPASEAILHRKKITVDEGGVLVKQKVEWLKDYEVGKSYMAMMPPLKSLTDSYCTDRDPEIRPIGTNVSISDSGDINAVYLSGESGFRFGMRVGRYLADEEQGNRYLITDNGGVPYNKMYFCLLHKGSVSARDIWETETLYTIEK